MPLIDWDDAGHLRLRDSVENCPNLPQVFEVFRRAPLTGLQAQDITPSELGDAPSPGFHLPANETGREDSLEMIFKL
ncbi:hypothetical protein E7T09_20350 [Deinococcus sp. KSM4-11]|uniref:hypothetical protein n=1 Tax=Deinococcus sp. KSM4-11 TaxID=2568654 RepID=UPI0010A44DE5|nr:hypothetical protein [Deinococcus sp. KSM4-11]THF84362.1 hypothetical protein E7T09_20350 [Deinococcus sp. KSM4-11]